jgi:hypothetical protein
MKALQEFASPFPRQALSMAGVNVRQAKLQLSQLAPLVTAHPAFRHFTSIAATTDRLALASRHAA